MNDITNLNEKLSRIKDATDSIRNTLGMTTSDVIENVASGVSTLNIEKEELEDELEHAEERVLNEYFNINLDNTTSWHEMQKQAIPYQVNGLSNLDYYFEAYPFEEIQIGGVFGKPSSLHGTFERCKARVLDIPAIDTSQTTDFSRCFNGYGEGASWGIDENLIPTLMQDWDTSAGEFFDDMFRSIWSYEGNLDLSGFDTSAARSLSGMLAGNNLRITGFENWDVSNVDNFGYLFQDHNGYPYWDLDLTNWYNNKQDETELSLAGMCGWGYMGPQRILMPNIKNDYRDVRVNEMVYADYHLMFIDVSGLTLTESTNGVHSMFLGLSPWCAIIVKDEDVKQKITTYYSEFKQVYTKAEYNANDNLYTTFNLYISDRDGNDLADINNTNQAKFYVQYQDENENWADCWWDNGNQLAYLQTGYPVVLPRGKKYRFGCCYGGVDSEYYEFDADQEQIDVEMVGGPEMVTFTLTLIDTTTQEPIEGTMTYDYIIRGIRHADLTSTNPIQIRVPKDNYVDFLLRTEGYNEISYQWYIPSDIEESLLVGRKQFILFFETTFADGSVDNTEYYDLALYRDDVHVGTWSFPVSGGQESIGFGTVKEILEEHYQYRVTISYENEQLYNVVYQYEGIDTVYQTWLLPTPQKAMVIARAVDMNGDLIDASNISYLQISETDTGSTYISVPNQNTVSYPIKVGKRVHVYCDFNPGTYMIHSDPSVEVVEDIENYVYLYASPAASFTLNVYDETGSSLPAEHDIIYRLYTYNDNYEQTGTITDTWGSTPSHTYYYATSWLENTPYVRACALGYEGNYNESWSDYIPLTSSTTYTIPITVRGEPEPENVHATIYFNDTPTLVSFSCNGTEYEYEQTSAQTFELDVPPMQDLHIYAECEGYDPVDIYWSIQTTDFEASFDFSYHYTITVYDENGELISDGDENLEIYDDYREETDHSNPFVIREITPSSSFNITVSYPGYLTQTNSVTVDNNDDSWDVYLEPEEEIE